MNEVIRFGVSSFVPNQCLADDSESESLTSNAFKNSVSASIKGAFQNLLSWNKPNICKYVDCKIVDERIIMVSEHFYENMANFKPSGLDSFKLIYEIFQGLNCLHKKDIVHHNLAAENIVFDISGTAKITGYAAYFITKNGKYLENQLGYPLYLPPEVIFKSLNFETITTKTDVWMAAVMILDWFSEFSILKEERKDAYQLLLFAYNLATSDSPVDYVLRTNFTIPDCLKPILDGCLVRDVNKRLSAHEVLEQLKSIYTPPTPAKLSTFWSVGLKLNKENIFTKIDAGFKNSLEPLPTQINYVFVRPLNEIYYLWKICGGDAYREIIKNQHIKSEPPILKMQKCLLRDVSCMNVSVKIANLYSSKIYPVNINSVTEALSMIAPTIYFPLIHFNENLPTSCAEVQHLPKNIKEKIFEYQVYRMVIFQRLIDGYPYTRHRLIKEANMDIPPAYRNFIWAALLDIPFDYIEAYEDLDKISPHSIDHQLDVDIIRCHQYSSLMSSLDAHRNLKRILKAWISNQERRCSSEDEMLVYWQGLDSLTATFLSLNMGNEAIAWACLERFVDKFCNKIFLKDNSKVMKEYLTVFKHILCYHDPQVLMHLHNIAFEPELFAFPWFLTMFSHIFPFEKIYLLWDVLLLGSVELPMCIGVAILLLMRDSILAGSFNDCINLFGNIADMDVEKCISLGLEIYNKTPLSITLIEGSEKENFYHGELEIFDAFPDKLPSDLDTLSSEIAPRISAKDAIRLLYDELFKACPEVLEEAKKAKINDSEIVKYVLQNSTPTVNLSITFIDTRSREEFASGHIPTSINKPTEETKFNFKRTSISSKNRFILCGKEPENCIELSCQMVEKSYKYVSVLAIPVHELDQYGVLVIN